MRNLVLVRNEIVDDEIQRELSSLLEEFTETLDQEQGERAAQLRNDGDIFEHNLYSAAAIAGATVSLRNLIGRNGGSVESLGFIVRRLSDRLKAAHLASLHPGKWSFPQKTLAVLHKIRNALERRN